MARPAPIIAGTLATLLLLIGAYMGSYYALLEGSDYRAVAFEMDASDLHIAHVPIYRIDGALIEGVFLPAHSLDRLLRASYWKTERSGLI